MPKPGDAGSSSGSENDSFFRAIAAAPAEIPDATTEADPTQLAQFRVAGRLGAGGMGVVYRAKDTQLRRDVALKLLPETHTSDPERRERFLREARAAASIAHPNVAVVYQVGEEGGRAYIAMELVEGVTLRKRLEGGRLPSDTAREIAVQIARGLAAAHVKGIVHRDLKPENVMVTSAGVVKLLDFGLAKSGYPRQGDSETALGRAETEAQLTHAGYLLGSSAYMSPEQALGMTVDARSDVFSYGIVLYEMLSGNRPFLGTTTGEIRASIVRETPPPLDAAVDAGLARVVRRCLEKRVEDRYADADAVARALAGESSPSAPAGASLHLVVRERGAVLRALPLRGAIVVGRSPQSDVVVLDSKVSRRHVRIEQDGSAARVTDLKSKHGTLLDGKPVSEATAKPGAVVAIGDAVEIAIASSEEDGVVLRAREALPETALSPHADRRLKLLYTISAALSLLRTVDGVTEKMLAAVCEAVAADGACLDVLDPQLYVRKSFQYPPQVGEEAFRTPPTLLAAVVSTKEQLITAFGSAMTVPLMTQDSVGAVLHVVRRSEARFEREDLEFLNATGFVLAAAMAQAEEFERARMAAAATRAPLREIVGAHEGIERLRREIARAAKSEANVLICGERGTGKELVAHQIHAQSRRAEGPFVAINCAAIPDALFESEMFGAEPSAANDGRRRDGAFLQARCGTIFLDEISELTPLAQSKLARVIESGSVRRLGAVRDVETNVRIVAASQKHLPDAVARGTFREDLCFRLNVVLLEVPPLRNRKDDIFPLATLFAQQIAVRDGAPVPTFTPAALRAMSFYPWPGNVRELKNEVERAMVAREGSEIDRTHLSDRVQGGGGQAPG